MMTDERDSGGRDGSTSRSLLDGARCDQPAAWARLVNLYAPLAAAWCRRWHVAEQDIGDVLQEVFAAAARNLSRFRKTQPGDTFRAWLATIARNKVRDYYRHRADHPSAAGGTEASRRLAQMPDADAIVRAEEPCEAPAEEAAVDADFSIVLRQALDSIRGEFHDQTWRAFWSVVVEGRAAADVAADLSMQPGAVRVCKSRVLARLRRELGDLPQ